MIRRLGAGGRRYGLGMAVSFDRIADRYDATRGGDERGRDLASSIAPWLVPGPVLEVCVGTGVVAAGLVALGHSVSGVDISPQMAARARVRLGPRVALGDALALPVARASVTNVVIVAGLHLVGGVPEAVREAARVLRPGGRLVAVHSVPQRSEDELSLAMSPLRSIRERRPDNPAALAAAAAGAGLTPVSEGWTTRRPQEHTPRAMADEIEQRSWSYLWPVDDEEWRRVVVPVIAALRALPDQDRPRLAGHRHRLTVFGA